MGRYSCIGMAYSFAVRKDVLESTVRKQFAARRHLDDVKEQITMQMFPDIYGFRESGDFLRWEIRDDIPVTDLTDLVHGFGELMRYFTEWKDDRSLIRFLNRFRIREAFRRSIEIDNPHYRPFRLFSPLYHHPFRIDGTRIFVQTEVRGVALHTSTAKTMTEDDVTPYDIFTELLRYRMRPLRLADSMLAFLTSP